MTTPATLAAARRIFALDYPDDRLLEHKWHTCHVERERAIRQAEAAGDDPKAAMADELAGALGKHDREAATCPIDKHYVSKADLRRCSRCGARPSEDCQVKTIAAISFVTEVRTILTRYREAST